MTGHKWARMGGGSACVVAALVTGAAAAGPALADEGPTTNPELNAILDGAAGVAQQPLLPGLPTPPPGMDLNQWAMLVGSQIGIQEVYDGTSPIYDNGAIDGMNDSLGIAFPNSGGESTIDWGLGLLDDHGGSRDGGSANGPANYYYYNPAGSTGQPFTGPTLPWP